MKFMIRAVALVIIHSAALAGDMPYGWEHCRALYADQDHSSCVAYVVEECASASSKSSCIEGLANDWRAYDVNLRLMEASRKSDLKALADASFASSALLRDAAASCDDDVQCHLVHAIENALMQHAASE